MKLHPENSKIPFKNSGKKKEAEIASLNLLAPIPL